MPDLTVGAEVEWSPGWGLDPWRGPVTVLSIEHDGRPVEAVEWPVAQEDPTVMVDLDNGYWAYGYQLRPTPTEGGSA